MLLLKGSLYYGWVLVTALAVTETISWGILYYAYAVFVGPMRAEMGWSTTAIAGAFSLALAVSGAAAIPVGRWVDRQGARVVMTAGSVGAALLVLAWSRVTTVAGLYVVWALLGLAMSAVLYEPAFVVVAVWFRRRRIQALTVLTLVAGFASVLFVPLAEHFVAQLGWREAAVALACILAAGTIAPHAFLLRRRPEDHGLQADGAETAPDLPHLQSSLRGGLGLIILAFTLSNLAAVAVTVLLVSILTERGYPPAFAAVTMGAVGLAALPGRAVLTPLASRLSRYRISSALLLAQGIALLLLLGHGRTFIAAFIVLFGAGFGALTPARAALVADAVGHSRFGQVNGLVALFVSGARAISPVLAAWVHELTGSFTPVLWFLAAACGAGAGALLWAERRAAHPDSQSLLVAREPS